ncbi:MFS transporter permease [Corynebacterium glutamicum]|uniref:MDR family MFS transporter n=1 Tax=Corynebacterium glutamicum TaxID=1718 RepID=UPI0004F6902C|nr:MDR family MFS transporter [Corynebacterium glutamicum]AIK85911.1 MFS transporter permease [Corynebacterium glutamicum]AIK88694.1 MFS transporter permease [Corynebacterium glutamicum]
MSSSSNPTSSDSASSNPTTEQVGIPRNVVIILAVLVFTAFVMMLNETTLAVALPSIMEDFDIEANTAQWLLTGFMLTMAVVLPATGWMLERFTTRSVFIFATVVFLIGTVTAALSPTFAIMLAARVAQAIGTAVIMPLLMTVAMTVVPPERRGAVMGLIAVVMAVGPALGPSVAGFVLSLSSWHAIFWVMVPLVFVASLIGTLRLTNVSEPKKTPLDVISFLISAVAFGGLVYALSSIGIILEGDRSALVVLAVGIIALVVFVWRQISMGKQDKALLDLRPLAIREYTIPLVVLLTLFGALLGVMNTLPLYLQGSLMVTALVAGLVLLPGGLLEGVLSPFVGRIYDRHGPRGLVIGGMSLVVISLFALSTVDEFANVWFIIGVHIVFSIGLALLFTPLMTVALASVPDNMYGHGSAILNTLQQLAGAAGTAVMIAVYSTVSNNALIDGATQQTVLADGANSAFFASACVAVFALIVGFFVKRPAR